MRQYAGNVLVAHRAEHGIGVREKAHIAEVLRQHRGCVRIVADVEHDGRLAGQHLEAPRQFDVSEAKADVLRRDR